MEPFARLARRVGQDDQLSPTARILFAALDAFLDKRTGDCAPSINCLAGWLGKCRRTIYYALGELEAAGYLAVERSSGRRNAYRLLPCTGAENCTGLPYVNERTRGKEQRPPSPVDLFDDHYRPWFTSAIRYHLADVAELEAWGEWFPPIAADFFLSQSWHRKTDPETAVAWARRLAAIAATPAEASAAFTWAMGSPGIDSAGRKVFSRPDHLARIVYRIQSQRRRSGGQNSAELEPRADPGADRFAQAWAEASAGDRAEVEAAVRHRAPAAVVGGLHWRTAAGEELARVQARAATR